MARSTWFRVYTEILDDPKIQLLPDRLYRLVMNLWAVTKENDGVLPGPEVCAFRLHMPPAKFDRAFLEVKHLFDDLGEGRFAPHGWTKRQYEYVAAGDAVPDSSRDRMRRLRQRRRDGSGDGSDAGDGGDGESGDGVTALCDGEKNSSPRVRADALSESVSGSEICSSGENNGKPKERLPPRNPSLTTQVTDPQWFEFMAKWAKTGGVEASVRDWDEALSVWKTMDFEERLEASMGLDRDHVGKENCLPQNYLGKRIYRRGVRKTTTNSRSDELRRVLEAREAQRS